MADQAGAPGLITYELRVWLPDRPGALGEVATRIGSVGGDVVGIEILETGGGSAIDDLTVTLPATVSVDELIRVVRLADGVAIEEVVELDAPRPDAANAALHLVGVVVGTAPERRLEQFCTELRRFIAGDWSAVVSHADQRALATSGEVPDLPWLAAFLEGSRHLRDNDATPGDIVWCELPNHDAAVASGRSGRVFHARERDQVRRLGEIVNGLTVTAR